MPYSAAPIKLAPVIGSISFGSSIRSYVSHPHFDWGYELSGDQQEPASSEPRIPSDDDKLAEFEDQVRRKYGVTVDEPLPDRLADLVLRLGELRKKKLSN